jgi:hypothetical protein
VSLSLPKKLFPLAGTSRREKLKVMKARQSALSHVALTLLQKKGYVLGLSLKIPGAFGYHAIRSGRPTKIGIKTSADRWVGVPRNKDSGSWGLLDAVDELFVVTFNDRYDRKRLQVIAFDPKKVVAMGEKVVAKQQKKGQTGLRWIPLDPYWNEEVTGMTAGPLGPHGTIIFDEEIQWTSSDDPEPDKPPAAEMPTPPANGQVPEAVPPPLRLTIPEAKAALALTFGVSPDAIKITVEG